jgi:hypothetical protein
LTVQASLAPGKRLPAPRTGHVRSRVVPMRQPGADRAVLRAGEAGRRDRASTTARLVQPGPRNSWSDDIYPIRESLYGDAQIDRQHRFR